MRLSNGDRRRDKSACIYLQYQGEFQYQNCTLGSLHVSDHDGVGRNCAETYAVSAVGLAIADSILTEHGCHVTCMLIGMSSLCYG